MASADSGADAQPSPNDAAAPAGDSGDGAAAAAPAAPPSPTKKKPRKTGSPPTESSSYRRIMKMMAGEKGWCSNPCGSSSALELRKAFTGVGMQASKTIWYVRGKRVKQWCKEYMDFPTGKKNMSIFIRGLIKVEALHPAVLQDKERKILAPLPLSRFDPDTVQYADDAWYIWGYEGDMTTRNIQLALLIGTLFLMCLAPVWPRSVKIGVWWLSVTLLIIMIGFSIVRMLIWLVVWIVSGYNLTIFPYIFIDGIPISEAFQPWGGETEYSGGAWYPDQDPSMRYYRIGTLAAVVAMGAWIALQPTKFDDYVATTREFTADLYEGNLLSDMSQQARDNIDKPRYQSLAEILMEEAAEAAAANEQAKEDSESADTTGNDLIDEILEDEAAEDAELEAERATAESSDL